MSYDPQATSHLAPPPPPPMGGSGAGEHRVGQAAEVFDRLVTNMATVVQGKTDVIRQAAICLMAEGHLLIEDVPGTAKTTLARALAGSLGLVWNRIQFTPDLLPSDVTGSAIYNQKTAEFEFRPGAVFANVVLGDEINRASPKTQSALLEVMEEGTVTTDAARYPVPKPFMVVATQNPVDMEGTYPLPEAQLDRFLLRISMGYPSAEAEASILRTQRDGEPMAALHPVVSVHELNKAIEEIHRIEVAPAIEQYIVALARYTRDAEDVELGVSPRGSLALLRAARAAAAVAGRAYVIPEDVKSMAPLAWPHRMLLLPEAAVQKRTTTEVVARALQQVPVPRALPS